MAIQTTYAETARTVWDRYLKSCRMESYTCILALHAGAYLAKTTGDTGLMQQVEELLKPFLAGEIENIAGAYGRTVYRCGGAAAAFLQYHGIRKDLREMLVSFAEKLCREQPRGTHRLFVMPKKSPEDNRGDFIWIDSVWGVCLFLLWIGKEANRPDLIDEACFQMEGHHRILFAPDKGLYHQAINAKAPDGKLTAFWSRGQGWGVIALAEMAHDLPEEHPFRPALLEMYRAALGSLPNYQDEEGMWHQVIDHPETYTESSGTGLILYAMGRGIQSGLLDEAHYRDCYLRGLRGLARYIALDGSVFNCCVGCLSPGKGDPEDYNGRMWQRNDSHGFGPMILAYTVAESLARAGRIPLLAELLLQ